MHVDAKNKETKYKGPMGKIKESESESSQSEPSDSRENPMSSGQKLRDKSAELKMLNATSSADDIPKNVAPPAPNKKRDLALRVVSSTILISF